jgi:hypothetical protein
MVGGSIPSHDDTPAARTSTLLLACCRHGGLTTFGVLFLDKVLRLDRHVQNVGRVGVKLGVCGLCQWDFEDI